LGNAFIRCTRSDDSLPSSRSALSSAFVPVRQPNSFEGGCPLSRLRISVFVALVSVFGSVAYAQQGSITGTVIDDTKSVLPGVSVTATDQEAGRQLAAVTNEKGDYRLANVPAGKYTIQAELSGFTTVVLRDVEILVGQNATISITLKLASV